MNNNNQQNNSELPFRRFNPDAPENLEYLICYISNDETESSFEIVKGRQSAYELIVSLADDIDLYHSFMVSSKTTLRQKISLAKFLLSIYDGKIEVDRDDISFKIENYVDRDEVEF